MVMWTKKALWMFAAGSAAVVLLQAGQYSREVRDGVEIVNNAKISTFPNGAWNPGMEIEAVVDFENVAFVDKGLTDIGPFDIDSRGRIVIYNRGRIHIIFPDNRLLTSFARTGQGPGELGVVTSLEINARDEIVVFDRENYKFVLFSQDGLVLKEIKITISGVEDGTVLENGMILAAKMGSTGKTGFLKKQIVLLDREFHQVVVLDECEFPNPLTGKMIEATFHNLVWKTTPGGIFTANQERGYEIRQFDNSGRLRRVIHKKSKNIPPSPAYKKKYMDQFKSPLFDRIRDRFVFPKTMPAFHSFTADDKGRLLVMTYEEGTAQGQAVYDGFDEDGRWIIRLSHRDYSNAEKILARIKNGRLYAAEEKENGYKLLVVYRAAFPERQH
jgi:hypothetical protein